MKADRDEASPYAAMLAAQDVAEKIKVKYTVLTAQNNERGNHRKITA